MPRPTPTDPDPPSAAPVDEDAPAQPGTDRADDDARWARRLHDVTHEVELIISGAVLFGLIQIPGRLDRWYDRLEIQLDGAARLGVFMGWYYTKLIVFTLIFFFGLHLLARAYWVGLLGLDSVFPGGIRWDRFRYGPVTTGVYRQSLRPLSTLARKAERVCSTLFSFAFWLVLVFAASTVFAGALGAVAVVLSRWVLPASAGQVWVGLMVVVGGTPLAFIGLDRLLSGRLDEEGTLAGVVRWAVRMNQRILAGGLILPIRFTLFTNVPRRVMWSLFGGYLLLMLTVFAAGEIRRTQTVAVSPTTLFPSRPGPRSVDARYYADTRTPGQATTSAPFLPSEIVEGPYVRLEVPFEARRHRPRIERLCAGRARLGGRGLVRGRTHNEAPPADAMDAVLACVAGLWEVTLDGRPLSVAWQFRSEPGRGVTGVVAYLPTADLAPGGHLLDIREVAVPGASDAGDDDERRLDRHFIPFRK